MLQKYKTINYDTFSFNLTLPKNVLLHITFEKKYWASFLFSDFALKNREGNLAFALNKYLHNCMMHKNIIVANYLNL